jgi:hypothetical protein
MGKASSAKKARRATLRDRPRLIAALRTQHSSLRELGASYDSGWEGGAYHLAVVVRVLCHDTSQSRSLLEQLGEKTSMRFKDTAWHSPPGNLLPTNGLVIQQMTAGTGLRYVAPVAMELPFANPDLPFEAWWTSPIGVDGAHVTWNRKRFILTAANQEGGAHIDPMQELDVRALEEENSMGWTFSDPWVGTDQPALNGPMLPSIRQISYELQRTLEDHFRELSPSTEP